MVVQPSQRRVSFQIPAGLLLIASLEVFQSIQMSEVSPPELSPLLFADIPVVIVVLALKGLP
jgi:hypothetical protein